MDTYYKYSSLMNVDFFKNPTIKISAPAHLNDPYECQPSTNIKKAIELTIEQPCPEFYIEAIEQMIESNGIISLSETQRNSLMWAHYGDHHKGMCIGLEPRFMRNKRKSITSEEADFNEYCISVLKPKKVNYDNHRFDTSRKLNKANVVKDAFMRHFLTKSDEWIYEKEHRCIASYLYATHILINDINEVIDYNARDVAGKMHLKTAIEHSLLGNIIERTNNSKLFKITNSKISLIRLSTFSVFPGVSFLQEIDPKSIREIYFGCRAPKDKLREIYYSIQSDDHPLKHVDLFLFATSGERFELTPHTLNETHFT
ncbi:hypothetical protein J2S82_002603 [Aeromonas caviae]|uniref:DUF2971 domain-containing protein n=1 Tax=Aeromonas caviae TaxID=648 RepID=UPI0020A11C97|nr:DUF2971 domain-containing protein [Aeromonas caviae]MCP1600646.1 hypothetical protein [Aeromonas caviae]